ncbi:enoyl-CoA hydratase/isomerase family protein [Bacillus sp. NTK071]|uniref:enoyl-CoA hydratase/isomerase family protein n=1 Tax=Bacillus sp. NTK071 TaxID=2802175 RepID=UPI001A90B747|nr:enoyl-CoA hydratase/isomerase family protein [Bacillus sp. NTK071]MBN8207365.1 enoyl-CoA hydratase/isomerase family protein [Bacillus sp. NTK071]
MSSLLEVRRDGAAILTINRSEQRNAINYDVMGEMLEAISRAEDDPSVSYIVVTGSGERAFCSGGDVRDFYDLRTEEEAYPMLRKMGDVLERLFFCKKPTVALLNGHAVGGGSELAIACDYRISRRDVQVGFIQGSIGLTTGWGGTVYALERMSADHALQMLMSADRYSADEALKKGYITYITTTANWQSEAYEYISNLFKRSSPILSSYKMYWLNRLDEGKIRERIEQEIRNCAILWAKDEHHTAVEAFLNKKNKQS